MPTKKNPLEIGVEPLNLEQVFAVAMGERSVVLSPAPAFRRRLEDSLKLLAELAKRGDPIYGITTGFGDSCESAMDLVQGRELGRNLYLYHQAGVGERLTRQETRAVLLARLVSLSRGHSGVRTDILERICRLLSEDALPPIPALGSVGASGDLTPLAYVAAAVAGEGHLISPDGPEASSDFWTRLGLGPYELNPRETLAIMNGTSVMTGLAALAVVRAKRLLRLGVKLTAIAWQALEGAEGAFSEAIICAKPHKGSDEVARLLRAELEGAQPLRRAGSRIQDRYSIRCTPQILGVFADVIADAQRYVEVELNSASDNPILDVQSGSLVHGGNFYGGHICHAMDGLKVQLANAADLFDRQLLLLCNPTSNVGLPPNLSGASGPSASSHHGFKAMQITTSALAAEAAKQAIPMSIFSRSTENHNQDKVSMGTIAARDALRILDLGEMLAAIHVLAVTQAADLRGIERFSPNAQSFIRKVRVLSPMLSDDRPLDRDIERVLSSYRAGEFVPD